MHFGLKVSSFTSHGSDDSLGPKHVKPHVSVNVNCLNPTIETCQHVKPHVNCLSHVSTKKCPAKKRVVRWQEDKLIQHEGCQHCHHSRPMLAS